VTGEEPVTPTWLWSQHNEHRMLLPRLIYLALSELSGYDFRAGAVYNVLALSALSAVMIMTCRALRGGCDFRDAYFPLMLLNWHVPWPPEIRGKGCGWQRT
jgi:hypothetical protein